MLLQLKNISKGYGQTGTHSFRSVLNALNLEIGKGEKIAIIGPSGSGKTTLLNLIGALDLPDSGEVIFDGKNITGYSKKELATFRNQHLGFIFQLHHLMPWHQEQQPKTVLSHSFWSQRPELPRLGSMLQQTMNQALSIEKH